jgi:multiple sugar transport system substrate-binding protein
MISAMLAATLGLSLVGCGSPDRPDSNNPITLTVWHVYEEDMRQAFDTLVDEFNEGEGRAAGVRIEVTAAASYEDIDAALMAATGGEPGAPQLPDIAVMYTRTATKLDGRGALADLDTLFSAQELAAFVPPFLDEGRVEGKLRVLPIAKSTEVLYVNKTVYDRFAKDTGATLEQLSTVEGLMDAAEKYYEWTDAKTPDVQNDGKSLYYPDDLFNFIYVGMKQLGVDFMANNRPNFDSPAFTRIWNAAYDMAVLGRAAAYDDYGTNLLITGDVIVNVSTSAGSTYNPDTVTYPDNTKEEAEFVVLPYPVFEGGEKIAIQRGGGAAILKSEPKREYGAALFLKWLTAAQQNLRFTAATGYMPVTQEAFDKVLAKDTPEITNDNVRKTLETVAAMQDGYTFYPQPAFDGFDAIRKRINGSLFAAEDKAHKLYLSLLEEQGKDTAFEQATRGAMDEFIKENQP